MGNQQSAPAKPGAAPAPAKEGLLGWLGGGQPSTSPSPSSTASSAETSASSRTSSLSSSTNNAVRPLQFVTFIYFYVSLNTNNVNIEYKQYIDYLK
jgi:hypothetical protein